MAQVKERLQSGASKEKMLPRGVDTTSIDWGLPKLSPFFNL
jgi:hypothetical protein